MPKLVAHNVSREQFDKLKAERAALDGERAVEVISQTRQAWPEPAAGAGSQLAYSYLWPLLCLGAVQDRTLSNEDLFDLPKPETSITLSTTLQKFYRPDARLVEATAAEADASFWRLSKALWALVRPLMVEAGWCNLLACSIQVTMPLLLRELVLGVAEPDPSDARRRGLRGACFVALGCILQALSQQRQQHLATRSGQRMRACLIAEVFDKATTLSPRGRVGVSKGEVNNLVAVDTQKIFEVSLNAHLLWSSPLQVVVVAGLLLGLTGPSTLLGIATLVAVLPLSKMIIKEFMRLRQLRMIATDERVQVVSEVLSGIRVTKLNGWEPLWIQRLHDVRRTEVMLTASELWVFGWSMMVMVMSPVLALMATISLQMLSDPNARLSAANCFATLALISSLRFPINQLGQLLGQAAQAWKSMERIAAFLERESEQSLTGKSCAFEDAASEIILQASGASFCVGGGSNNKQASSFTIEGVNLIARAGEVICIVGAVAAGKSTLLDGLQGFAEQVEGPPVTLNGSVAFAAQTPFILNATVKDNIFFGRAPDSKRYAAALEAAQLSRDLELLPAGDETEIGEKGVNLSGGQKARVALARCVYGFRGVGGDENSSTSPSSLALLDDPLGALDASTALKVFDALFGCADRANEEATTGALCGGATLLVTHATHFLPRPEVSRIIVLKSKGFHEKQVGDDSTHVGRGGAAQVIFNGTWAELVIAAHAEDQMNEGKAPLSDLIASAVAPHSKTEEAEDVDIQTNSATSLKPVGTMKQGALIKTEQREEGVSSSKTWIRWIYAAGGMPFLVLQISFLVLDRASYALTEFFLAKWTEAEHVQVSFLGLAMPSQDEDGSALQWFLVYFCLFFSGMVFCFARTQWGYQGGIRAARSLYLSAQERVLFAPMAFFDTTPLGRLLNRFSYDTEVVDVTMTMKAAAALISVGWFLTGVAVMTVISKGVMLCLLVPQAWAVYQLQLFYRRSAVDLQRIDAVSRSPLQSLLAEGLDGANTIRAFKMQSTFLLRLRAALDTNTGALLCWTGAQRWMGLRLDLLATVTAAGAAVVLATLRDALGITPGLAGVLMVWAMAQSITFMFMINTITEAEAAATSVERVLALAADTPQEAPHTLEAAAAAADAEAARSGATVKAGALCVAAPTGWPWRGELAYENVRLRYRPGLEPALRGLTFKVAAGTRCGVVGRTGAGKSTLVAALFRLAEEPLVSGRVLLDGVDLASLCLRDVRARKPRGVVVIPQDPVLFSGSLRACLDPFGAFPDADLLAALDAVGLKQTLAGGNSNSNNQATKALKPTAGAASATAVVAVAGSGGDGAMLLSLPVNEGGSNWSVGERQLLALARAMLEQPRVLVLDEATASVDGDTDARIQRMLRTLPRLQDGQVTVLSVAHRLHTVMDFDQILVMDAGVAAECGPPAALLAANGLLAQLVDATGHDSAAQLRATANAAAATKASGCGD